MNVADELKSYVNLKEHSGAVFLTGSWGCGKTYLINEFKREIDSNERAVLIVSLFGLESNEAVTKAIKDKIIAEMFSIKENCDKNGKSSYINTVLRGVSSMPKIKDFRANLSISIHELIEIKKTIDSFPKQKGKEIILVFDDFERTNIDFVELLGMINEYCENRKIKTIVVANEEKIISNKENQDGQIKVNSKYTEFKEKVIQTTLNLDPDYRMVIDNIILGYIDTCDGYKKFLLNNNEMLKHVFYESAYNNFRTFKSILVGFERVFKTCSDFFGEFPYLNDLLYSYSAMIFEEKNGKFKRNKYGQFDVQDSFKDKYTFYNKNGSALDSFKVLVGKNEWNESIFLDEIRHKYNNAKLTFAEKFLLYGFWGLNEKIIEKGLPEVVELAYEGELTLDEYITMLNYTSTLTDLEYEIPCEMNFKKMRIGLKKKKEKILNSNYKEPQKTTFIQNGRLKKLGNDAIELNEQIEMFDEKMPVWSDRKKIINSLKTNCDFTKLYNKTVDCFDKELLDILTAAYNEGSNFIRREIGYWFNTLQFDNRYCSNTDDLKTTVCNIKLLIRNIEGINTKEDDKFSKIIHNKFLGVLHSKIEKLENGRNL
ncbi:P-loop NTPase fold protein [Amedibacillus dolichus]|uniref:P-loop NTPase fold protein n=1 Tax=Amedibacillus dolichus TaxID=31971 RepID=UPI0039A317CA